MPSGASKQQLAQVAFRHLRAFVVLSEELHFGRAAQRLHLAQPALTQTLQQLEAILGVKLVSRSTRRVELTEAGRAFRLDAQALLDSLDAAVLHATRFASGETGTLRIGYMIGAALEVVPTVIKAFQERSPDVVVETYEYDFGTPTAGLAEGLVDVAIVRPPVEVPNAHIEELFSEPRVAILPVGHPLAGSEGLSIAELLDEPIVAAPFSAGAWRDYWICAEYREGKPANVVWEAATREAELHAVALGRGIAITSATAAHYYRHPGVVYVEIVDIPPCSVALAWMKTNPSTVLESFRRVVRDVAHDLRPAVSAG